jgi:hypothetical protein
MNGIDIGQFELAATSGLCLARAGSCVGLRLFAVDSATGAMDGKHLPLAIHRPPRYAADGAWGEVRWRVPCTEAGIRRYAVIPKLTINAPTVVPYAEGEAAEIVLRWHRDGTGAILRWVSDRPVRLWLLAGGSFAPAAIEALADGAMLRQDNLDAHVRLAGSIGAPRCIDEVWRLEQAVVGIAPPAGTRFIAWPVELAPGKPICAAMGHGAAPYIDRPMPDAPTGMTSTGTAGGALASLVGYSRCWDPQSRSPAMTVNRTWGGCNQPGLVFGWDNVLLAWCAAWTDPDLARHALEHICARYGANGIAHGPVQRNLIIPLTWARTVAALGDDDLARRTWPVMMAFMRFWWEDRGDGRPRRDGNRDGLIESGTDLDPASHRPGKLVSEAMDETGYDESPIYSAGFTDGRLGCTAPGVHFDWASRCLAVTLVGQNSLYVASCRALAATAERLGLDVDRGWLLNEAERVATGLRTRLFDAADGIFRDRWWRGGFSPVLTHTTFYPLLAGIADQPTAARLRGLLTDPAKFWGDNLLPTVARDDPAFGGVIDGTGNYWRGNCWPPTTYIVGLGLRQAGMLDLLADYTARCQRMFDGPWLQHAHAYENYPAHGAMGHDRWYLGGWGGREPRYTWAALLPLQTLEQVVTVQGNGLLAVGNPYLAEAMTWEGFHLRGHTGRAEAGRDRTVLELSDGTRLAAEPGCAIRDLVIDERGLRASVLAPQGTLLHLSAPPDRRGTMQVAAGDTWHDITIAC